MSLPKNTETLNKSLEICQTFTRRSKSTDCKNINRTPSISNSYKSKAENSLEQIREILDCCAKPESDNIVKKIVKEITEVEYNFCVKLTSMSQDYPEYITNNSPKNKDLLKEYPIISEITNALSQILDVHHVLLERFAEVLQYWDDNSPNLASVVLKHGHYLKICSSFLRKKNEFVNSYKKALSENEKLSEITKLYEKYLLNNNNGNDKKSDGMMISMGLTFLLEMDSVHQNIVRYSLLMERYSKAINRCKYPDEYHASIEALTLVKNLADQVNETLIKEESTAKLLEFNKKLNGKYNVISPCRTFIYDGVLTKQARRDKLQRYLILFNDVLFICNCTLMGKDIDPSKIRVIDVESYDVNVKDHVDYENQFELMTEEKSTAFICSDKEQRDIWVKKLRDTKEAALSIRDSRNKLLRQVNPELQSKESQENKRYKGVWIPDNKSTICLMPNCGAELRVLRRHHCRRCGYLICSNCTGEAPIPTSDEINPESAQVDKVCPQCFFDIKNEFGHIFKAKKFKMPKNHHLRKSDLPVYERILIFEKNKTGETKRWVNSNNLSQFNVYKAEFDLLPIKEININENAYAIIVDENASLGATFTILNMENKFEIYKFRVEHERKIEK
uniref:FYVE-type domain-containing protein n=1 Tax=Parastrongyloides trichosuri TaxID=131310 RepID=A0A0N4ZHM0_PARTI